MPRWKALPDELGPEVREFTDQLRRLVDHSGLSIAAVSDRTGYSKTSWERYLNGRLLAPKGAVVALAEVTGTQPVHLITMWELAERAWSRSEMRHDMTMQAIRISQARAALGELGEPGRARPPSEPKAKARNGTGGVGSLTGVAGPAGVSPTVPPQASPTVPPQDSPTVPPQASPPYGAASSSYADVSTSAFGAAPAPAAGTAPAAVSPDGQRRRRKLTMFLAGVVGALVVIAAALFLTDRGGDGEEKAGTEPSASPTTSDAKLPAGVECRGADCAGKDPENMGCGGELARTTSRATVGKTLIEVRYSKTCAAAWARITQATPGDEVTVTGSGGGASAKQRGTVNEDFDAYTPMVAVKAGTTAKACAVLTSGEKGCTE
ncbi:hypothetical protein DMA15_22500 [Streptomyces sp. WAC 01529]|uniref:helix-turn-helix domain-containing protein n=1 Tax=Streptomyces sp. WAC 01529 TaxID=2203205 RepID=UPI000F6DBE1C|nr:XRE family transcriptional regulator [Streptomyces sp. WAC 01529]AZM54994.1 hypothetical protein DMA15_22500 [Streptomyces sp. WAC 01529]